MLSKQKNEKKTKNPLCKIVSWFFILWKRERLISKIMLICEKNPRAIYCDCHLYGWCEHLLRGKIWKQRANSDWYHHGNRMISAFLLGKIKFIFCETDSNGKQIGHKITRTHQNPYGSSLFLFCFCFGLTTCHHSLLCNNNCYLARRRVVVLSLSSSLFFALLISNFIPPKIHLRYGKKMV